MEMLPALVDPRTGMRKIIDMFSSRMMRRRNGYTVGKLVLLLRGMSYLSAFITVWVSYSYVHRQNLTEFYNKNIIIEDH